MIFLFENQPNEICTHFSLSEKASKGRFPKPEKLQNHSNESKELKRKRETERARRRKGGEKKAMIPLFAFIIATLFLAENKLLNAKGPFGDIVIKNPDRCIMN